MVVQVSSSPRSMSLEAAKPIFDEFHGKLMALTADAPHEFLAKLSVALEPLAIQLTASETPETVRVIRESVKTPLLKSLHLPPEGEEGPRAEKFLRIMDEYIKAGVSGFILDTRVPNMYGGSGIKSDWNLARRILEKTKAETFIAGGINPANVLSAVALNPHGIDLASGVEDSPGVKSRNKIKALFTALEESKQ